MWLSFQVTVPPPPFNQAPLKWGHYNKQVTFAVPNTIFVYFLTPPKSGHLYIQDTFFCPDVKCQSSVHHHESFTQVGIRTLAFPCKVCRYREHTWTLLENFR